MTFVSFKVLPLLLSVTGIVFVLIYVFLLQKIVKNIDSDLSSLRCDFARLKKDFISVAKQVSDTSFALSELEMERALVGDELTITGRQEPATEEGLDFEQEEKDEEEEEEEEEEEAPAAQEEAGGEVTTDKTVATSKK